MSYKFFQNKECEYFPCHGETNQNCMFCYCPLYPLRDCGGDYVILENGVKDCSGCLYPHDVENYEDIMQLLTLYCYSLADDKKFVYKEAKDGNID